MTDNTDFQTSKISENIHLYSKWMRTQNQHTCDFNLVHNFGRSLDFTVFQFPLFSYPKLDIVGTFLVCLTSLYTDTWLVYKACPQQSIQASFQMKLKDRSAISKQMKP